MVHADSLWATSARGKDHPATSRRGAFEQYAAHLTRPFVWMVLGEPIAGAGLARELQELAVAILPLTRGEVGESRRTELERLQARNRELSRLGAGCWRVRVLVGADSPSTAGPVAAMLCAAANLDGFPYTIEPLQPMSLDEALLTRASDLVGSELLAALMRPPAREVPGVQVKESSAFDVTIESENGQGEAIEGIPLGDVLDDSENQVGKLTVPFAALNRHTFVSGATGSGKSQTVRHLLAGASQAGLPWLVIEPAKAEYARMSARLDPDGPGVIVIRPGDPNLPPAGLNPLEPDPGFPLQTHVDLLRTLFLAAFEPFEPFPQILAQSLLRCYEELGWDLTTGTPRHARSQPRYPTLGDLERVAAQVVLQIGYGEQATRDVTGFIKVRIGSLRVGTAGRFFEGGHRLDFGKLLSRNVVLELEDVGDDMDKAFVMGAVLIRMSEHLRVRSAAESGKNLSHLTVIEEAHRLLRRPEAGTVTTSARAVEMFGALLAEVRAYGEGLVIAEQIPSKLLADVIKNTAVKIVHRLPARDDRDSVGATMNLDDHQSRRVVSLQPGHGAAFIDGMDRPVLVKVPDGTIVEATLTRPPASVISLIERRSPTCGMACQEDPCTLRQIGSAQQFLRDQPWLRLWGELCVVAHLAGYPVVALHRNLLPPMEAGMLTTRTGQCALGHVVDDAVAVRATSLSNRVPAHALSLHVLRAMTALLNHVPAQIPCAADHFTFLARQVAVIEPLEILRSTDPTEGRHPLSAQWEERLGRVIPGTTATEQLALIQVWWNEILSHQATLDAFCFGTARPSALEMAVGSPHADPTWNRRLSRALEPMVAPWASELLVSTDTTGGS